ncbi:Ribosomal RNA small subunit methyltransferase E [Planctomycetes bacterium Pla163]|uniref:Ribosomal RNA small subunit methyltransferase E n=1 Tax=Rohdeia mirabilis TaxID=2528008 RepID=A0A518CXD5_9BACT|nr:Ribosomal RNA small subunit methyltransferase E [Planctomycetes bacterium Pla163]
MLFIAPPARPQVGAHVPLDEDEFHHAVKVLRLREGARVPALDGAGGRYELAVERVERRSIELVLGALPTHEPAPGEPGAPLPRIELAVAWPKDARGEDMLGRLVQHGVARIRPLLTERTGAERRAGRRARLERLMKEHLKQCGRAWLPVLDEPASLEAVLAELADTLPAPAIHLDPRAAGSLATALAEDEGQPSAGLLVGPEGGWSPAEEALLEAAGTRSARLGPHVLRIETAAEAAAAFAATLLARS